ncbi:hypothetical protein [Leadbetterella sp. DM7]|uniref:hypothetical protein n=1 Tax=Leadbetterella sp. DM7 TaxID=3235085 RepID=UPI00349EFD5A
MPFYKEIPLPPHGVLMLWKVETGEGLPVSLTEASRKRLAGMKRQEHRNGFLAVRMLLERAGLSDDDVLYEADGRPLLKDGRQISISHSHAFAALYTGPEPYGIDIEKIHPRIIKNRPHFIRDEVILPGFEPETLTLIWTVKEAIFKLSNSRPLSFLTDLHVHSYDLSSGTGTAVSTFPGWEKGFCFQFEQIEDYMLTWCKIT